MSSVLGVLRAFSAHARDAAQRFFCVLSVGLLPFHLFRFRLRLMALVGSTFAKKVRGGLPPLHTAAHRSAA